MLLGWRPSRDLGEPCRLGEAGGSKSRGQVLIRRGGHRVGRERSADPGDRGFEAAQDMIRVDAHRFHGHLGGDRGIAIAIAAHPATQSDECRSQRRAHTGVIRGKRGIKIAIDLRHCAEERLVEDRHNRAHLIQGLDLGAAELGRTPQKVDLLQETSPCLALLAARGSGVVEHLQLDADPHDRGDDSPASGLGRMSGEHRLHDEVSDELAKLLLAMPRADLRYRLRQ